MSTPVETQIKVLGNLIQHCLFLKDKYNVIPHTKALGQDPIAQKATDISMIVFSNQPDKPWR